MMTKYPDLTIPLKQRLLLAAASTLEPNPPRIIWTGANATYDDPVTLGNRETLRHLSYWMWLAAAAAESIGLPPLVVDAVRGALLRVGRCGDVYMPYNAAFARPSDNIIGVPAMPRDLFSRVLAGQYCSTFARPAGTVRGPESVAGLPFEDHCYTTDLHMCQDTGAREAVALCASRLGVWACVRGGLFIVPRHWTYAMLPAVPALARSGQHRTALQLGVRRIELAVARAQRGGHNDEPV
jgi:hypothetical protein